MKKIAVFGSTGSIGINTLKVISAHPGKFRVTALSCNSNVRLLIRQIMKFKPEFAAIGDLSKVGAFRKSLKGRAKPRMFYGRSGIEDMAKRVDADIALMAISGNASLIPLVRAIESGMDIALASKEPLVSAGKIVMALADRKKVRIIPVDSEHSAIFQCLNGRVRGELKRIYLTGSGGPLRMVKKSFFDSLPRRRVLDHPKWKMGRKISVDSATLMNKGLEVIEAASLFGVSGRDIKVLIHPQAMIHSMVEFIDGSILAQIAIADMRMPIGYALNFPDRLNSGSPGVSARALDSLTFHEPDTKKFPCLSLAYKALETGGSSPAVLNASNEEAVRMYLAGVLNFTGIAKLVEKVLSKHKVVENCRLKDIINVDKWAREQAKQIVDSK